MFGEWTEDDELYFQVSEIEKRQLENEITSISNALHNAVCFEIDSSKTFNKVNWELKQYKNFLLDRIFYLLNAEINSDVVQSLQKDGYDLSWSTAQRCEKISHLEKYILEQVGGVICDEDFELDVTNYITKNIPHSYVHVTSCLKDIYVKCCSFESKLTGFELIRTTDKFLLKLQARVLNIIQPKEEEE